MHATALWLKYTGWTIFLFITRISPLLSGPSLLWLSDTGGEPGGSEVELVDCEGLCSWYRRFLSFSSSVFIVLSVNSSLGGPSPSDSAGPLPGCVCEVVAGGPCCVGWAGLWGCDCVGGGAGVENGCWSTTGWTWFRDASETGLGSWLACWWGGTFFTLSAWALSAWEVGGTIGQHVMSATMDIPAEWVLWGSSAVWGCSEALRGAALNSGRLFCRSLASSVLASWIWAGGVPSGSDSQIEDIKQRLTLMKQI